MAMLEKFETCSVMQATNVFSSSVNWNPKALFSSPQQASSVLWECGFDDTWPKPPWRCESLDFTILLPPATELLLLDEAIDQHIQRESALNSMLLHVLDGRFTQADLESKAKNGRYVCSPRYYRCTAVSQ